MKVDRTKYTAHYENGMIVAQWISVDMVLDGANGESALAALDRSKELVDEWYKKQNIPNPFGPPPVYDGNSFPGPRIIEKKPEDREIGITESDIWSCEELVILDSYRLLVKGNDSLSKAYVKRRKELAG
jgi:hypothetical protein